MNILIKLMSIVSLVIAPTLAEMFHTKQPPVPPTAKTETVQPAAKTVNSKATAYLFEKK